MNNIKSMTRAQFAALPTYNKDSIHPGFMYKIFSAETGANELKTCYVKIMETAKDGSLKPKIYQVNITD